MRKLLVLLLLPVFSTQVAFAQPEEKPITLSAYGEVYYGFDLGQPSDNNRPNFIYSHNRHNEVNLNLAMLKASYDKGRVRGNIALMTGTYANANLASEPGVLKNIYVANAGIKLLRKRDLWVDAGIFESHIGAESAISMDCPTLTRSLVAENSPYYEAGVRLSYKSLNQKWYLALMHLNGWQRIQRLSGSSTPSGGMQVKFSPNKNLTFNLSTFVGTDHPDTVSNMRYFVDFYTIIRFAKKFELTATIDAGNDQSTALSAFSNNWLGSALILKYQATKRSAIVARGEYFYDPYNIVMYSVPLPGAAITPDVSVVGYSLGYDLKIMNNVLWRIEGKNYYSAGDAIFTFDNSAAYDNYAFTTSLAIRFNSKMKDK